MTAITDAELADLRAHDAAYKWLESDSPYLTLCAEERRALLRHLDHLAREKGEVEKDAARYREFWKNPVSPLLDDLGLQIVRYGSCKGVFNKAWCDEQLDAAALSASPTAEPEPEPKAEESGRG